MVDARQEVIDELENFEKDLAESYDDEYFDSESVQAHDMSTTAQKPESFDEDDQEDEPVAADESGQESDSTSSDQSSDEKPKPRMVTLPDDKEAFGKFAGQKISYEQLAEEGLVDNLVTWGHQGRHMVSRGQEDLEEARKMRQILEEQLKLTQKSVEAQNAPPPMTPEQHAAQLVDRYLPDMQRYAEAGGVEPGFLENYPKAAAYIEDRFQAASTLGNILVKVIDELKQSVEPMRERDTTQAGQSRLRSLADEVSKSNELFSFIGEDEGYREFMKWATAEDSTLNWVDKNVEAVTPADIQASALLYMHQNPGKFKRNKSKPSDSDRRLAGGGTGQTKPQVGKQPMDEITAFQQEYAESFKNQEF